MAQSGSDPAPRQRVALVGEAMRTTDEPSLNTATSGGLSLLGSFQLLPRLYLGAQAPLVFIDEDSTTKPLELGYGDTRLNAQIALGDLNEQRETWTLGFQLSVPTRTVRYQVDPGRQWALSPMFSYTRATERLRFFAMVITPLEIRPAGVALELSPSLGVGYQILKRLSVSTSLSADIRLLTLCTTPRESYLCAEGRASEVERELGATRLYGGLTAWLGLSETWALFGSGQLPFTAKRDFAYGANLGLEARF